MFQKAIAADAKDSRAYFGLGQVYLSKESHALAISNYEKCLALEPDFLPARHSLGLAYASAGRTSDAIRTLEAILKDYPADATAQLLLDLARTKNGPARSPR
jgi:lipopolysaccharide biosynthesis regulator YciM